MNESIEEIKSEIKSEIALLLDGITDQEIENLLKYRNLLAIVHAARKLGRLEGIKIVESEILKLEVR